MPRTYPFPRSQERSSPRAGSRRDFLKTSAAGVSGIALASALGLAPRSARADQLTYAFWPWGSEIVAEGARNFEEQYGEALNLQPIPGEYAAVLETKLASGQAFDLFRAQRGQASRWYAAQWIRPIDDLPDLDEIVAEEFPGIGADARSWPDGKRIGLTYYNGGPFCLFRNEKVLSAAGYEATATPTDYPQTWDEVYKQAVDIKKKGIVEHPILPAWYKAWTGTPWALYAQAFSEGEHFVDDDMKATFGPDTPLLKVLTDWKQWWDEDLVPRAILTWQELADEQLLDERPPRFPLLYRLSELHLFRPCEQRDPRPVQHEPGHARGDARDDAGRPRPALHEQCRPLRRRISSGPGR